MHNPVVVSADDLQPLSLGVSLARIIGQVRRILSMPWSLEAKLRGVEIQGKLELLGRPIITRAPNSRLILKGGNTLSSTTRCSPLGNFQPCILRTLAPGARLEIGENSGLSSAAVCAASSIIIGPDTLIGSGALIFDTDFHSPAGNAGWIDDPARNARPIKIGRGCFIGARSIILKGVVIGDRAAVAAGAVVTCRVPSGAIAMGNPARIWPWKAGSDAIGSS